MVFETFGPILKLHMQNREGLFDMDFDEDAKHDLIYVGKGASVNLFQVEDSKNKLIKVLYPFRAKGSYVFGIATPRVETSYFVVYGEKSLVFYSGVGEPVTLSQIYSFSDWIQTAVFLDKETFALTFGCNIVAMFYIHLSVDGKKLRIEERNRVQSEHKTVLSYALLDGETWEDLKSIVGTLFGEILISMPCQGPAVKYRLEYHTGMIFGLMLLNGYLYSISDDRSLSMWCMRKCELIDNACAYSARPFAICAGDDHTIFTGSQDSNIYIWSAKGRKLSLLQQIRIGRGSIRSLLFSKNRLFLGSENGFFGSIHLPRQMNVVKCTYFQHDSPVKNFACLSAESSYFIDDNGYLFTKLTNTADRVTTFAFPGIEYFSLSSLQMFLLIASSQYCTIINTRDSSKSSVIKAENGTRFSNCIWSSNDLFLFCSNGKVRQFGIELPCLITEIRSFDIGIKSSASAVFHFKDVVIIGTKKGKMLIVRSRQVISVISGHCKEAVTDLVTYGNYLYSLGRDGKLCKWQISETSDELVLLERVRPSQVFPMEWPCKFLIYKDQLFIAGFYGSSFLLIHYNTDHCVCRFICGGGHRSWQILLSDIGNGTLPSNAHLTYINKGIMVSVTLHLYNISVVLPNAHTSSITAVCALANKQMKGMIVTGSFDTTVTILQIQRDICASVLYRSRAHTSSVYSLSNMGNYVISAGGKSELFLWYVEKGTLRRLWHTRLNNDCRLISVCLFGIDPVAFVVSASDGRLLLFELKDGEEPSNNMICTYKYLNDRFLCTKVYGSQVHGRISVFATTTVGKVIYWPDVKQADLFLDTFIEKAGLSALHVHHMVYRGYSLDSSVVAFVGSESGTVTAVKFSGNEVFLSHAYWHAATCTDLCFYVERITKVNYIISVSINRRLAVFKYCEFLHEMSFVRAIVLDVADPSAVCLLSSSDTDAPEVLIAGSCLVKTPLLHLLR